MPSELERYRRWAFSKRCHDRGALNRAAYLDRAPTRRAGAELYGRGLHPALTLVAGERRLPLYRHATPVRSRSEESDARVLRSGYGLYANL